MRKIGGARSRKLRLRNTVALLLTLFAATIMLSEASEERTFKLQVIEIDCGLAARTIEVCENPSQFLEVRPEQLRHLLESSATAVSKSSSLMSYPEGSDRERFRKVLGGTISIRLSWSPIDAQKLLAKISYLITEANEDVQELETQAIMSTEGQPIILSGVARNERSETGGKAEKRILHLVLIGLVD